MYIYIFRKSIRSTVYVFVCVCVCVSVCVPAAIGDTPGFSSMGHKTSGVARGDLFVAEEGWRVCGRGSVGVKVGIGPAAVVERGWGRGEYIPNPRLTNHIRDESHKRDKVKQCLVLRETDTYTHSHAHAHTDAAPCPRCSGLVECSTCL